jgi:hypothetical protein
MQPRGDGPGWDTEGPPDLFDRETDEMAQDDDRPVLGAQPLERSIEGISICERLARVRARGVRVTDVEWHQGHGRLPATVASSDARRGIDHESIGPRLESVKVTQLREVLPHGDERLLHRILGLIRIAKDSVGDPVEASSDRSRERLERWLIAGPGQLDELQLRHRAETDLRAVAPTWRLLGRRRDGRILSESVANAVRPRLRLASDVVAVIATALMVRSPRRTRSSPDDAWHGATLTDMPKDDRPDARGSSDLRSDRGG